MNPDQRIRELDVLRGFAVLGIFYINIVYFALPADAIDMPLLYGESDGLNYLGWWLGSQFLEGAMFALFSMLFGASALILLDENRLRGADGIRGVERYYRRNLWLIAFGLVHAFLLLSPTEILFTYGILGLFLFPLRRLGPGVLLAAGLSLALGGTVAPPLFSSDSGDGEGGGATAFDIARFVAENPELNHKEMLRGFHQQARQAMREEVELYRSGYGVIFTENGEQAIQQQTEHLYRSNLFDAGGMMLAGMALMTWGVLSGTRSTLFYLVLAIIGHGVALAMRLPIVQDAISYGFPPRLALESSSVRHALARLPPALGHIGLLMLLCRSRHLRWLSEALSAAGRLALSNYLLQSVQVCRYLVKDFGTSQSPKSTRQRDSRYCPDRPALITTPSRTLQQSCSCATPS
ncbi:MAG: DUF418 domain-containing protein [gamma proteobacterium symbiont of Phacoides pectinatus]